MTRPILCEITDHDKANNRMLAENDAKSSTSVHNVAYYCVTTVTMFSYPAVFSKPSPICTGIGQLIGKLNGESDAKCDAISMTRCARLYNCEVTKSRTSPDNTERMLSKVFYK